MSEAERISVNNGGTLAPTAAPGGIAGTGISALAQVAPPPPPSESEEESDVESEEAPPSPATQRRSQWAQYRQRQVDAHQARVAGYTNILDKMLHL